MKVTDLRIGNYIQTANGIDEVRGVLNRNCFKDVFLVKNGDVEIEDLQPIPLTEEWLLKLGFEENAGNTFSIKVESDCFKIEIYKKIFFPYEYKGMLLPAIRLKYIHELQNLYHAITGNELKIKQ